MYAAHRTRARTGARPSPTAPLPRQPLRPPQARATAAANAAAIGDMRATLDTILEQLSALQPSSPAPAAEHRPVADSADTAPQASLDIDLEAATAADAALTASAQAATARLLRQPPVAPVPWQSPPRPSMQQSARPQLPLPATQNLATILRHAASSGAAGLQRPSPGSTPPAATLQQDDFARERLASVLYAHIRDTNHASCVEYVEKAKLDGRPYHEARRLAQAIDAFIGEGVSLHTEGLEILLRALTGVVFSEQEGNKKLLDHVEWNPPGGSLPPKLAEAFIKVEARRAKTHKKSSSPGADGKRSGEKK
jgi:hypothetical protein